MKDIELPPLPRASWTAPSPSGNAEPVYSKNEVNAILRAAIEADRAQRVPDAWTLVPVEPTDRMLNAASLATESEGMVTTPWLRKTIYFAMLSAAPAQPAQPVERKPMTDEIVRLAGVALNEMPHPVTNWQSAAKKVCEAVAAIKEQT